MEEATSIMRSYIPVAADATRDLLGIYADRVTMAAIRKATNAEYVAHLRFTVDIHASGEQRFVVYLAPCEAGNQAIPLVSIGGDEEKIPEGSRWFWKIAQDASAMMAKCGLPDLPEPTDEELSEKLAVLTSQTIPAVAATVGRLYALLANSDADILTASNVLLDEGYATLRLEADIGDHDITALRLWVVPKAGVDGDPYLLIAVGSEPSWMLLAWHKPNDEQKERRKWFVDAIPKRPAKGGGKKA